MQTFSLPHFAQLALEVRMLRRDLPGDPEVKAGCHSAEFGGT
jgi:hypothetical protein